MSARVRVSASTSNLGGGFDCIGVAIDRWLSVEADLASGECFIDRGGALALLTIPAEDDRLVLGYRAAASAAGVIDAPPISIRADSEIPVGRGLGSSAAAVVAGAHVANQLLGLGLEDQRLLDVAGGIEGHPDNAAQALFGGANLVTSHGDGHLVRPLEIHPDVALVFAVPDFAVETRIARAVLPEFVPHRVATAAASRAAALVQGLACGDPELIAAGLDDVLHVPFRRRLVKGYAEVTRAARDAGAAGATLSGSGSSIVAVALQPDTALKAGKAMVAAWASAGVSAQLIQPSIVREALCP